MLMEDAGGVAVDDVWETGRVREAEDTVSVLLVGMLAVDTERGKKENAGRKRGWGVRGHTRDHISAHKQWQCSPSSWSGIRHGYASLSSS